MDINQQLKACIESFDQGDYSKAAREARRLFSAGGDPALGQILLISLQRLGNGSEANRVGSDLLTAVAGDPWQEALVRLSLGQVELKAVLAEAHDAAQECQALYYAGARSLTENRVDEAQNLFDRSLFVSGDCLERMLAYFQITTLAPRTATISRYLSGTIQRVLEQARILLRQGRTEEGLAQCQACRNITLKYFEKNHPTFVVQRLTALGDACVDVGRFLEALGFFMDAVTLTLQTVGERHPDFARCEENLAAVWVKLEEYGRAEPMLRLALDIYRTTEGEQSDSYLGCLGDLARLCVLKKDLAAANQLLDQALELDKRTAGTTARTAVALADAYLEMKRHGEAAPLYSRAIVDYRRVQAVHSETYARALDGLGRSRMSQGRKEEAEALLRIALAIHNHNLGGKSRASAATRSELAALLGEACEEDSFPESLAQFSNLPGEFLSYLYLFAKGVGATGEESRAEALLRALIEHCRNDTVHARTYIQSLLELAHRYERAGTQAAQQGEPGEPAFAQADLLVGEALEAHQAVGGAEGLEGLLRGGGAAPPDRYLENALVLSGLLASARGRHEEAYSFHARAAELRSRWLINPTVYQGRVTDDVAACIATGRFAEALRALRRWASDDEKTLTGTDLTIPEGQLVKYMREFHGLMQVALSYALCEESETAGREVVLDMLLRRKGVVADVMRLRASSRGAPGRPAVDGGPDAKEDHDAYRVWLRSVSTGRVADVLPMDSALVEFVQYRRVNFKAVTAHGEARWTEPRYFALILPAAQPDRVTVLDLGDAKLIEEEVGQWLRHMQNSGRNFQTAVAPADAFLAEALHPDKRLGLLSAVYSGARVRQQLLDPVTNIVGPRTRLILAPEGVLSFVPFQALTGTSGEFVTDERPINYVTTGRDLLRTTVESGPAPSLPVVIADPDYDWRSGGVPPNREAAPADHGGEDAGQVPVIFTRLPGTRQEGEDVARRLRVKPWLDADALKGRVKALKSPSLLHIATHGFFLPVDGPRKSELEDLLRGSGLALTGANVREPEDTASSAAGDGILTALDVMTLQLAGTELVVLSACETGLGGSLVGEGVFGLRRAFLVAGARTLVVSLWRVPDKETCDLMGEFYKRLQDGAGVAEALDAAQRVIRAVRQHPFYWGAFVCIGDGSPLALPKVKIGGKM